MKFSRFVVANTRNALFVKSGGHSPMNFSHVALISARRRCQSSFDRTGWPFSNFNRLEYFPNPESSAGGRKKLASSGQKFVCASAGLKNSTKVRQKIARMV